MLRKDISFKDIISLLSPQIITPLDAVKQLNPKKILCLSDTTNVFYDNINNNSLAVQIAKRCAEDNTWNNSEIEFIQADYVDFRYNSSKHEFGAHLPQNINESRREYHQVNNSSFNGNGKKYDIILGKSLLCCCHSNISCGGIEADNKKQSNFIQSLLDTNPDIIILSANWLQDSRNDTYYLKGKQELLQACQNISTVQKDYDIAFIDNHLTHIGMNNKNNGYVIIIFNNKKLTLSNLPHDVIIFTPSTHQTNNPSSYFNMRRINPFVWYQHAIELYKNKQYDMSIKQFEFAIEEYTKTVGAISSEVAISYNALASCYRNNQQIDKAIDVIEKSIMIASQLNLKEMPSFLKKHQELLSLSTLSLKVIYDKAILLYKEKKIHVAINQFEFLLEKYNDVNIPIAKKATCYSSLASSYRDIGNVDKAIECCNKALQLCLSDSSLNTESLVKHIQIKLEKMQLSENVHCDDSNKLKQ